MGWSIQAIPPHHTIINDLDIIALINILADLLRIDAIDSSGASDIVSTWIVAVEESGPGTIDLHLQDLTASPERTRMLHRLLTTAEQALLALGDSVPRELLNKGPLRNSAIFTDNYPVPRLLKTIVQLRDLAAKQTGT